MANSVDPPHLSVRKKNAELLIIMGSFDDCSFDRARSLRVILWVDAFDIFFPGGRSFSWIEAIDLVKLLGEMLRLSIR